MGGRDVEWSGCTLPENPRRRASGGRTRGQRREMAIGQ